MKRIKYFLESIVDLLKKGDPNVDSNDDATHIKNISFLFNSIEGRCYNKLNVYKLLCTPQHLQLRKPGIVTSWKVRSVDMYPDTFLTVDHLVNGCQDGSTYFPECNTVVQCRDHLQAKRVEDKRVYPVVVIVAASKNKIKFYQLIFETNKDFIFEYIRDLFDHVSQLSSNLIRKIMGDKHCLYFKLLFNQWLSDMHSEHLNSLIQSMGRSVYFSYMFN